MDNADQLAVESKLEKGRKKYADCDWVRFQDDIYDSPDDAYKAFISLICMGSMFSPGKVVYCYGMPLKKWAGEYHQRIAKEFSRIPSNVCLIIIAATEKNSSLYKAAKALEAKKLAKIEEPLELSKNNIVNWITAQAENLGLQIDKTACQMLADLTEFNPGKIQNELKKMSEVTGDDIISMRLIEMSGFGVGYTDVKDLGEAILNNDGEHAHEYLQRLLDRGEPALKICGYLKDWITRLAIAQSAQCNFEAIRNEVSELKEWESDDDGYESVHDKIWGSFSRHKGETTAMFNANSLYYSCRDLANSNKPNNWAYDAVYGMGQLQKELRTSKNDEHKLMHWFVSSLIKTKKD
jgi:DNA polymerase III delta subunit